MNPEIIMTRDLKVVTVPIGTKVALLKGGLSSGTQSPGGNDTVVKKRNMFRIESKHVVGTTSGMAGSIHDSLISRHTTNTNFRSIYVQNPQNLLKWSAPGDAQIPGTGNKAPTTQKQSAKS
jgi:hypothetical protein